MADHDLLAEYQKPPKVVVVPRALPREVKQALGRRRAGVDSDQLLADLIDLWGGTRTLAKDIKQEFTTATSGGMTRQRILEMIQRLIVVNTTNELSRAPRPAEMSDQDLQTRFKVLAERLLSPKPAPTDEPLEEE